MAIQWNNYLQTKSEGDYENYVLAKMFVQDANNINEENTVENEESHDSNMHMANLIAPRQTQARPRIEPTQIDPETIGEMVDLIADLPSTVMTTQYLGEGILTFSSTQTGEIYLFNSHNTPILA